ncbi:MAG: copper resistance protein NlpE N-terminal domain-containing protein [Bacteroidota bacterium]
MISKRIISRLLLIPLLVLTSCGEKTKETKDSSKDTTEVGAEVNTTSSSAVADKSTSENSLDWYGIYQGTIPCADCEGIKTKITLSKNGTFKRSVEYLGKSDKPFVETGDFSWDDSGSKITISTETGTSQGYQVGENILFHLDQDGNRITGDLAENYKLMKNQSDSKLENKTWILTEIMGKTVDQSADDKKITITFRSEDGLVFGFNGCNQYSGSYELLDGNR